jgi:putative ABC transport system permease protein
MSPGDFARLSASALVTQRMRSFLTALGIAVGIGSVVLLTSIGEGVHRFVLAEFTQFGTNLVSISPGKTTTKGIAGGIVSNVRPLTISDAESLKRLRRVEAVVPIVQGNAAVESGNRRRRTTVLGVGPDMPQLWQVDLAMGRFLPDDDPRAARSFAVLGNRMRSELFGPENPLGSLIRIAGERYRVIGVMESKGQMLGFDLDDTVFIPAARALSMFNRESLMEINLVYDVEAESEDIAARTTDMLERRHGAADFTVTTQEEMLDTLGSILSILTLAVGALGGISLLVGGVGILTIMTISVNERTAEIGLLRAIGAERSQVLTLFLAEAVVLSALGGVAGLLLGAGGAWLLSTLLPALPVHTPWYYVVAAELLAIVVGVVAGVVPARNAAALDPVEALRAE